MKPISRGKYNKYIWEEEHLEFLKANFETMTNQELADTLGIRLTKCREKLYELGLKRMQLEYWTDEQVDFLKDNYKVMGDTEIAEIFEDNWPKKKGWSKKHIEKKRRYLKLKRTAAQKRKIQKRNVEMGRFQICPIKAWETRGITPVGTIKIWSHNGSMIAVIKQDHGFVHYNRWLFENSYFTLPSDILVVTRSGNIKATGPEDLMIIDRATHAKRNRELPEEFRPTRNLIKQIEKQLINT
ncbi:hypothetical protein [Flagellimonas sp.]|uniref:hypothetical protein n=1 Tax=Flagellimonas sp. TaxID=2058762 RepID=UPI003BAAB822